jgi:hypothetical protein
MDGRGRADGVPVDRVHLAAQPCGRAGAVLPHARLARDRGRAGSIPAQDAQRVPRAGGLRGNRDGVPGRGDEAQPGRDDRQPRMPRQGHGGEAGPLRPLHRAEDVGHEVHLLSDFVPRPVLCDDNLSALPADYQDFIIRRYQEAGVKLRDANSGFEPVTFTEAVYRRWKPILAAGGSPWRFGFDETVEAPQVRVVLKMLAERAAEAQTPLRADRQRALGACVARIYECINESARNAATGRLSPMCEPYVQWEMKLVALEKKPWVRFDWTAAELYRVQKWINSFAYRTVPLKEFKPNMKRERYDAEQGLFV